MKKTKKESTRNLNVKGVPCDVYNEFQEQLRNRGVSMKFQVIKFIKVWLEAIKKEEIS